MRHSVGKSIRPAGATLHGRPFARQWQDIPVGRARSALMALSVFSHVLSYQGAVLGFGLVGVVPLICSCSAILKTELRTIILLVAGRILILLRALILLS